MFVTAHIPESVPGLREASLALRSREGLRLADMRALAQAQALMLVTGGFFLFDPMIHPTTAAALYAVQGDRGQRPKPAFTEVVAVTDPVAKTRMGVDPKAQPKCVVIASSKGRASALVHFCQHGALPLDERSHFSREWAAMTVAERHFWKAFDPENEIEPQVFFELLARDNRSAHYRTNWRGVFTWPIYRAIERAPERQGRKWADAALEICKGMRVPINERWIYMTKTGPVNPTQWKRLEKIFSASPAFKPVAGWWDFALKNKVGQI